MMKFQDQQIKIMATDNIEKNNKIENIEKSSLTRKALGLLEYGKIMERVALCASSEEAAEIIRNETPLADPLSVEAQKNAVMAVLGRINSEDSEPRSALPSIGFLFPKLEVQGMALETDEAYAIGIFVEQGAALHKWLGPQPMLPDPENLLPPCLQAAEEIFRVIDRNGAIRDLPCLRAIKRRIQSLRAELDAALSRYGASDESRRMLQSALPSLRDGRTVLAVKANFRGRIPGIVHEVSSTGQTVFVEPAELVEKNNDILIEQRNLDAEIRRLLRELSAGIAGCRDALRDFHRMVIEIECARAKARYSRDIKGCFARNGDGIIMKQARHPLLCKPVPIDLQMDGRISALIITGPNTGGKTVALKTAGLFAMMNQSGLALPADEGAALPVFDGIYADIGDEQSIDQSLSTFSAHIDNIAGIIAHVTRNSLVLLDELGAGTDPEEGSALAMAVLDHLVEKKARLIITTHHGILKNYAYSRAYAENASVEFDAQTLSPTYRIVNGIPGESRALEIAGKNGLAPEIIAQARAYLADGRSDVSALIAGLKEKHRELDESSRRSREEAQKLREDRRRSDLTELRLRQKEMELKQGGLGKLRLLLDESRKTLENLVREVREGELNRDKTRRVKAFLEELARTVEAEDAALDDESRSLAAIARQAHDTAETPTGNPAGCEFQPGMKVYAGEKRLGATIIRFDKKKGHDNFWIVEAGNIRISFAEKDLRMADNGKKSETKAAAAQWSADISAQRDFRIELDLRGLRLEEALAALRRQIDSAVISGIKEFSVVHGMGDGILQKGVHEFLRNEPLVADYWFSRPELGGFGRTEVKLCDA